MLTCCNIEDALGQASLVEGLAHHGRRCSSLQPPMKSLTMPDAGLFLRLVAAL